MALSDDDVDMIFNEKKASETKITPIREVERFIVVKLQMEGFHCFENAGQFFPKAAFLEPRHRHIFHISLTKSVEHSDRDLEFILFKREVLDYLYTKYGSDMIHPTHCEFGGMSCEMIAEELLEHFKCEEVSCFEDNENGAVVRYKK